MGRQSRNLIEDVFGRSNTLSTVFDEYQKNHGFQAMLNAATGREDLLRLAGSSIDEIYRTCRSDFAAQVAEQMLSMKSSMAAQYCLPEINVATQLAQDIANNSVSSFAAHSLSTPDMSAAMRSMRTPWFDIANSTRSVATFMALQNIGHALQTLPTYSDELSELLRENLGDWRAEIVWPKNIFSDAIARTEFYAHQGLDLSLTAFPA
ncbi:MAG TPA: hypothetical protein ENI62_06495, partial [Gammaproteobacteria bacterium]|nr:hypothetical protein [Gammaproteobacteria bacterium]